MALQLDDRWIWDFWLIEDSGRFHVFYLQAPKSIGDPDLRHWNASIGHAVSSDLVGWEVLPDALQPGATGTWDDMTTWTGSVIRHDDRWHLFYTGTSTREDGLVQRIGCVTSEDLVTWERVEANPLIEADPTWYEKLEAGEWHDEAWRDPWVFQLTDGLFHATITARSKDGPREGRGVVAHAVSPDLTAWEVGPPLTRPDGFGQVEVSQLLPHGDQWYLVFCSDMATQSERRRVSGPGTGTYYLWSSEPFGPYDLAEAKPLSADRGETTYAGRLVDRGEAGLVFLSWLWRGHDGEFVGGIADPRGVEVTSTGDLLLASSL